MRLSKNDINAMSRAELIAALDSFRKGPGKGFDIIKVLRYIWTFMRLVAAIVNAVEGYD